jgi:hypothetical protein
VSTRDPAASQTAPEDGVRDPAASRTAPQDGVRDPAASQTAPEDAHTPPPEWRAGTRWRPSRAWLALFAVGVLLFLAISGVLARFFSAENVEMDHEIALVRAEVRGDAQAMLDQLQGCQASASCTATVRADAARLRRPGSVQILSTQSTTNHSLTSSVGETRVAWKVPGRFPVVQCVRVKRTGNFLTGISIALLRVSAEIPSTADC